MPDIISLVTVVAGVASVLGVLYIAVIGQQPIKEWWRQRRGHAEAPEPMLLSSSSTSTTYQNLPQPDYGRFFGRESEMAHIRSILRPYPHSQYPVVAIDGIGGIGKSALALEVAYSYLRDQDQTPPEERFGAFIWASAKTSVLTADGILSRQRGNRTLEEIYTTISVTLGREDITRAQPEEQTDLVRRALGQQRTLLIIDNLETVDDQHVLAFLRELPAPTKAIVTTRHRIDVACPVRLLGLGKAEAMALIAQQCTEKGAALVDSEALELYRLTDGMPLAIVWSIAQIGYGYTAQSILQRLRESKGDLPHFCFDTTLELVGQAAHRILLSLAVFAGTASREAIGLVAGFGMDSPSRDDNLTQLERLSLINRDSTGRFHILSLTRQFLLGQMSDIEVQSLRDRIAQWALDYVEARVGDERRHPASRLAYDGLNMERDNLLAVIRWCSDSRSWNVLIRITLGLGFFPWAMGYWNEWSAILELASNACKQADDRDNLARFQTYLGFAAMAQGRLTQAKEYAVRALDIQAGCKETYQFASTLRLFGYLRHLAGESIQGHLDCLEALSIMRQFGNSIGTARILNDLGTLCISLGHLGEAEDYLSESLIICKSRDFILEEARAFRFMGDLQQAQEKPEAAISHYAKSVSILQNYGWVEESAHAKLQWALAEKALGHWDVALKLVTEAISIYEPVGAVQISAAKSLADKLRIDLTSRRKKWTLFRRQ
jgi:tetratricopeptide (TPR) repeat protein